MNLRQGFGREGSPRGEGERPRGRGQWSPLLIFGIALFAAATFYFALIVATQADKLLLPGNEIDLPGLSALPGVDSGQPDSASIEERINILVMGLDRRGGEPKEKPTPTATMFLCTVSPHIQ